MTDADMFMGKSAPCSSSGIGALAALPGGVPELGLWPGLRRWLRVLDTCWFGVVELCGELGEDGFIMYVDNKAVLDIGVEVCSRGEVEVGDRKRWGA